MPHAKRSSAGKMHGGRPRDSLRSNSLGLLSAVCIRPALGPQAYVALATCPTRAYPQGKGNERAKMAVLPSTWMVKGTMRLRLVS